MLKTAKILFSRYGICIILIIAEIVGIVAFFSFLAHFTRLLWVAAFITSFIAYLSVINLDINPEHKIPWISIILLSPPFGALLYSMFYSRRLSKKDIRHMQKLSEATAALSKDSTAITELYSADRSAYGKALALLHGDQDAEVYSGTESEYFALGEDMFEQMLLDIERAEHFIFLEYFIVEDGVVWGTTLDLLKEKAKQGVEVRMLYDDIGCMATLPDNYDALIRPWGIECYPFAKFVPVASNIHNNRDHRKILVIDGKIGYTGGINLADEYINRKIKHGHWKDGGIRLQGMAVKGLTKLFLINWDMTRKTVSDYGPYLSCTEPAAESTGHYIPFGCGPVPAYDTPVAKNAFLNMINQSQEYVYITTPYLIIDSELTDALKNAAARGVDIRIITPRIPDKRLVQLMTRSAYPCLILSGVKIYEYTDGFIHSKNMLSDDAYAIVGTVNFDYRSLVHHYENAVWMYKTNTIIPIKQDFLDTFACSEQMTPERVQMSVLQKVLKNCIRLFAPML